MQKDEIIISFCIPTYNRAGRVFELVQNLLSYPDNSIEIVVLDNFSDDNTLDNLRNIKDSRLKLYSNNYSVPVIENWIKAFTYGQGNYLFHLNDRDKINVTEIFSLIQFLEKDKFSFVWCKPKNKKNKTEIFKKGINSLGKISFTGYHPTGLIFNRDILHSINVKNYTNYEIVDILPHNFLIFDVSFIEKTAFYYSNIWEYAENQYIKKNPSNFSNSKKDSLKWYEPKSRMKQLIMQTNRILTSKLINHEDKLMLINNAFNKILESAILEFRFYSTDEDQCKHHGVEMRKFKFLELELVMINFYNEFRNYLRINKLITTNFILSSISKMLFIEFKLIKNTIHGLVNFLSKVKK
jgi:glycosyltransferase involved in cell wall biosynthesis